MSTLLTSDLVSIIIPCYNAKNTIDLTLKSALDQTYSNIEIIVIIDDSSTDNTLQICKKIKSDKLHIFEVPACSPARKRNLGFHKSKGKFIQYLDADDTLSLDKISSQIELLSTSNSQSAIATSKWHHFKSDPQDFTENSQLIYKNYQPGYQIFVDIWIHGEMMQTSCWLTPRSIIEATGGWNEELEMNPNDDGEFFSRVVLLASHILFDTKALVYYRKPVQGLNVSQIKSFKSVESLLKSYRVYENILEIESTEKIKQGLKRNYMLFIYNYYNTFPTLSKIAEDHIKELGFSSLKYDRNGLFSTLSSILGFKRTLTLRKVFKGY